jgi:malic enzyme
MYLDFPLSFRGALDVRASAINEEMKMAATGRLQNCKRKST